MSEPQVGATQAWPDLSGRIIEDTLASSGLARGIGRRHVLPVRVYFEDTDFSGIVYHATYLRWCERGRSDFLRLVGIRHEDLIAGGDGREAAAFVVRRMRLDYLAPARIDDVLEVETQVKELGAATLDLDQTVAKAGRVLFKASVLAVLVSQSGKVMRLGPLLRGAFGVPGGTKP